MNIKYIGRHPSYTDNIYGTGLVWEKNKTVHIVHDSVAKKFLKHSDSFVSTRKRANTDSTVAPVKNIEVSEADIVRDSVDRMDMGALANFAFANFSGYKVDPSLSIDDARTQIKNMIDQFGDASNDDIIVNNPEEPPAETEKPSNADTKLGGLTKVGASNDLINYIQKKIESGKSHTEIASEMGVTRQKIAAILRQK